MILSQNEKNIYKSIKKLIEGEMTLSEVLQLVGEHENISIIYKQKLLLCFGGIINENCMPSMLPIEYKVLFKRLTGDIEAKKKIMHNIAILFDTKEINYAFVKGSSLSHLIYGNGKARQFNDIDIVVAQADICKACLALEESGYTECLINSLKNNNVCVDDKFKQLYFESDKEKQFVTERNQLIEVKRECGLLGIAFFSNALKRKVRYNDGINEFNTFSIVDTFVLLLWTIFENFMVEGNYLGNDFKARDIVDLSLFWRKYKNVVLNNIDNLSEAVESIYPYLEKVDEILMAFGVKPIVNQFKGLLRCKTNAVIPEWLPYISPDEFFLKKIFDNEWRVTMYYQNKYDLFSFKSETYDLVSDSPVDKKQVYGEPFAVDYLGLKTFLEIKDDNEVIKLTISIVSKNEVNDIDLLYDVYFLLPNELDYTDGISHSKVLTVKNNIFKKIDERLDISFSFLFRDNQKLLIIEIPKKSLVVNQDTKVNKINIFFSVRLKNDKTKRFVANKGHFFSPLTIEF